MNGLLPQRISAQIEYPLSGEVEKDSAEESETDYPGPGYQGSPEWSVGWRRVRLHLRRSSIGQASMLLALQPRDVGRDPFRRPLSRFPASR
jgi:hypothetical protein